MPWVRTVFTPTEDTWVTEQQYRDLTLRGFIAGVAAPAPPDPDDVRLAHLLGTPGTAAYEVQRAAFVAVVGTPAAPVTDANLARPASDGPLYWLCANGVTPVNAAAGDLIWNADA